MATHVDPRTDSKFEVIRGLTETAFKETYTIADANGTAATDAPTSIVKGEPVRWLPNVTDTSVYKINDDSGSSTAYIVGTNPEASGDIDRVAGISFTDFGTSNNYAEPDATEGQTITVLSGNFVAKISTDYFVDSTGAAVAGIAGDLQANAVNAANVGDDVACGFLDTDEAVVNSADSWYYVCLNSDLSTRYGTITGLTEAEKALEAFSIIGKVTKVTSDYVYVRFSI